jgi:hypothetical protein
MEDRDFAWNDYNLDKIAKHGVTRQEAEHAVRFFKARPHKKGTWIVLGRGNSNRKLQVIFTINPDGRIYVIHAMPVR